MYDFNDGIDAARANTQREENIYKMTLLLLAIDHMVIFHNSNIYVGITWHGMKSRKR